MGNQCKMLQLLIAHQFRISDITHIHDISFQKLIKGLSGIIIDNAWVNWPFLYVIKTMRYKSLMSQLNVNFTKSRLILIQCQQFPF